MSYGKKSMDGRRFIKTAAYREEFESSEAYSEMMMSFFLDGDNAIEFFNGILPTGFVEEMEALGATENTQAQLHEVPKPEPRYLTMKDVRELSAEEYKNLSKGIVSGEIVIVDE
jgi:hypothetical protein